MQKIQAIKFDETQEIGNCD